MFKKLVYNVFPDAIPVVHKSLNLCSKTKDVIILQGWGGAKQKNLKKIITFYQKRDVSVVASVMPLFAPTFLRQFIETDIALSVQSIRADKTNSDDKLYGHIYSNNGSWALSTLCRRNDLPPFDKLLYDSAPKFTYKHISMSHEIGLIVRVFVSTLLGRNQYEHYLLTPSVKFLLYLIIPPWRFVNLIEPYLNVNILPNYLELNIFMRDFSPKVPTYFIYSTGDLLLPIKDAQEYKKNLDDRGVTTFEQIFGEDVAHTGSFFKYPIEYSSILDHFFCLKKVPS